MTREGTSLQDRLDRNYADAWRPEPGDKLVGTIVEIGSRLGEHGRYPIVTIREDEGGQELAFHAYRQVAQNKLAELAPEIGERIAIRYDGPKPKSTGTGVYYAYKVAVDRPDAAFNWKIFKDPNAFDDEPATTVTPTPTVVDERPDPEDIPFLSRFPEGRRETRWSHFG